MSIVCIVSSSVSCMFVCAILCNSASVPKTLCPFRRSGISVKKLSFVCFRIKQLNAGIPTRSTMLTRRKKLRPRMNPIATDAIKQIPTPQTSISPTTPSRVCVLYLPPNVLIPSVCTMRFPQNPTYLSI